MFRWVISIALVLAQWAAPVAAQSVDPATLIADRVVVLTQSNAVEATGNVEIFHDGRMLRARRIHYNGVTDRLTIEGPLVLSDGEDVVFLADAAELDASLQDGIIEGARMVFRQRLQLAAARIERREGRYTSLYKAVTSSCQVFIKRPEPLWQIRAEEITHDAQDRRIRFRKAQFRIMGTPIFSVNKLTLPDPSVERATGFLAPSFVSNSQRGYGVAVPYFVTLGDYADITVVPAITQNSRQVALAFRKRWAKASLDLEGAVANDTFSGRTLRGYLSGEGVVSLANMGKLSARIGVVSDPSYPSDYGVALPTDLETGVTYERQTETSMIFADITRNYSIATGANNRELPGLIAEVERRNLGQRSVLGGVLGFRTAASGYVRPSTIDGTRGRDALRAVAELDWSRRSIGPAGLVFEGRMILRADAQTVQNDSTYPDPILRALPIGAFAVSLPMQRRGKAATHRIEPMVQIVSSPTNIVATPNEDSTFAELDDTNLFQVDRFAGDDQIEAGTRANIGITYDRFADNGGRVGLALGQVIRFTGSGQFTGASGLTGARSDVVAAVHVVTPRGLEVHHRSVFDPGGAVSRTETRLGVAYKRARYSAGYLWKSADAVAGSTTARSEVSLDAAYDVSDTWTIAANWRHDFATGKPTRGGLGATYRNECLAVDISLSRRFTSSATVSASTTIGATVQLIGFGKGTGPGSSGRRCATMER